MTGQNDLGTEADFAGRGHPNGHRPIPWLAATPASDGQFDHDRAMAAVRELLIAIGDDPDRDGLRDTPARVARAFREMTDGLRRDPAEPLRTEFAEDFHGLVTVRDIELHSLCEHHLLPFYGHAEIAYVPRPGRVTGLSKLARTVDAIARRPQVQERLTEQIAETLMTTLQASGVLVVVECEHLCMTLRGVRKRGSRTVTSTARGALKEPTANHAALVRLTSRAG